MEASSPFRNLDLEENLRGKTIAGLGHRYAQVAGSTGALASSTPLPHHNGATVAAPSSRIGERRRRVVSQPVLS